MKQLNRELEQSIEVAVRSAQTSGELRHFRIPLIRVNVPKRASQGDLSYAAMSLARSAQIPPLDVAKILERIIALDELSFVDQLTIVPPGYMNFFYSEGFLKSFLATMGHESPRIKHDVERYLLPNEMEALELPFETRNTLLTAVRDVIRQNSESSLSQVTRKFESELDQLIRVRSESVQEAMRQSTLSLDFSKLQIPDVPPESKLLNTSWMFQRQQEKILAQVSEILNPAVRATEQQVQRQLNNIVQESLKSINIPTPRLEELQLKLPKLNVPADYFEKMQNRVFNSIIRNCEDYFKLHIGRGKKALVEFVSANPSGPITIGHTRGAVIGDTMARLLEAAGYEVQREYYFNNAGNQMAILGKSLMLRYLQQLGDEVAFPKDFYQGDYLVEVAADLKKEFADLLRGESWEWFKDAAEARMFDWIKRSLASIDIEHDAYFNETSLYKSGRVWQVLEQLRENGHIYESTHWEGADAAEITDVKAKGYEPATWFRSSSFGDEKDRVMVRSDETPTYTLPDIAYHCDKLERGYDIAVNILGTDHFSQAQVVKHGISALDKDSDRIHVIFNQMVRAVRWNQKLGEYESVKQSKRAGDFDTLDDLVEMTSADAVRYHMLARSPSSQLDFDVDQVVKQSNDNPVYYIQNAYVRCIGIFREANERRVNDDGADMRQLGADELRFIRKVLELGDVIEHAVVNFEPHHIAFYAQDLASVFHPIYDSVRVFHSEVSPEKTKARLRFYRAAAAVFYHLLRLMGMTAPERM